MGEGWKKCDVVWGEGVWLCGRRLVGGGVKVRECM